MSTHEDRLAALERTSVSHTEAINGIEQQQTQALRDRMHEIAISLGVLTDDVRILKENTRFIKRRIDEGFPDLSRDLYSMEEKLMKRSAYLEAKVNSMEERSEQRFDGVEQRFTSLEERFEQRFTSLEGKFEQLLQVLTPPKTDQ